jgi:raffinose/stachyose/melibiose transport system permease protein
MTATAATSIRSRTTRSGLRARRTSGIRLAILWVVALIVVLGPMVLVVLTALKPSAEARSVNLQLPTRIAFWQNLQTVLTQGNDVQGFFNSLLISVPSILLVLFFASMAAWVFARGKRRSVQAIYYVAISGVMLPPAIVTTLRVLSAIGLSGSQIGLILFYAGTQFSIATFLMTGFVKGIPIELEEAARMDGASTIRVYWSIILPTLRPVLLTTAVILSLTIWNDFLTPFFLLPNQSEQTLPLGLYNFASANMFELNWNLIFTQILIVSLPLLILYLVAQRRIVSGLLGGITK